MAILFLVCVMLCCGQSQEMDALLRSTIVNPVHPITAPGCWGPLWGSRQPDSPRAPDKAGARRYVPCSPELCDVEAAQQALAPELAHPTKPGQALF